MGKPTKGISLFEIRLEGTDHDVIVVKGSANDAPSVLLSGNVVLSVTEPIQAKKISLLLYGVIKMNVSTVVQSARGTATRTLKHDKRFYEFHFDDIDLSPYMVDSSTVKKSLSRSSSSSSLGGLASFSRSTTSLKNFATGASHSLVLPEGNYVLPFSAILPGSLTESVEGLPNASVFYKLRATLERGKFASDLSTKKHVRVVRTLTPDALELFETVAVDNTWPKKVDYSISVPSKAIAIGSASSVNIMIVPLLKGLKLGPIKISLLEYISYSAPYNNPNTAERTIMKMKIRDPLHNNANTTDSDFQDKWEVNTSIRVPPNLSKCTQDCVIMSNIKVRHKLKFVIALINPDGHVSELRASLPVQLFISPFVTIAVQRPENIESSTNNSANNTDNEAAEGDDFMFANTNSEVNLNAINMAPNDSNAPSTSLFAPPNYGNHVYDRLWNDISVDDTALNSGTQSPIESTHTPLLSEPNEMRELQKSLQRVRIEREMEEADSIGLSFDPQVPSRSALATPLSLHDIPSQLRVGDYFAAANHSNRSNLNLLNVPPYLRSPSQIDSPGFDFMSRANSFESRAGSPSRKDWEISSLSRVPSYDNAMKTSSVMGDLPPAYPDEDEQRDKNQSFTVGSLEKPRELHHRGHQPDGSQYTSSKLSSLLLSNYDSQSTNALNMYSNDVHEREMDDSQTGKLFSKPILTRSTSTSALKNTASKHFGFSMTPLSQLARAATPPASMINTSHHSSSSIQIPKAASKGPKSNGPLRNGNSFASLSGILHKRESNE